MMDHLKKSFCASCAAPVSKYLILISDVDEIPNFESIKLEKINNQIVMFEQSIFYYKLNRYLPNFTWYGTKGCKKKYLKSPQWLRNIKNKKLITKKFFSFIWMK